MDSAGRPNNHPLDKESRCGMLFDRIWSRPGKPHFADKVRKQRPTYYCDETQRGVRGVNFRDKNNLHLEEGMNKRTVW